MGRQHVSAGAHRGQSPERGTVKDIQYLIRNKDVDVMLRRKQMFCSPGQRDPGGDPCEAAG